MSFQKKPFRRELQSEKPNTLDKNNFFLFLTKFCSLLTMFLMLLHEKTFAANGTFLSFRWIQLYCYLVLAFHLELSLQRFLQPCQFDSMLVFRLSNSKEYDFCIFVAFCVTLNLYAQIACLYLPLFRNSEVGILAQNTI